MKNKRKFSNYNMSLVSRLGVVLLTFITLAGTAKAELTQISAFVEVGNECNDYFNGPNAPSNAFEHCNIFKYDEETDTNVIISPVIAKFDIDNKSFEASKLYGDKVDKDDWRFSSDDTPPSDTTPGNGTTGSWAYNDGGGVDSYPGIRFWSAKAGKGFNLFWQVDTTDTLSGGNCDAGALTFLTLSCMKEAAVVLAGTWTTPDAKNLSHLIFYNSEDPATCTNDCTPIPPQSIPEPNTLILFFGGLLMLVRRRQLSIQG